MNKTEEEAREAYHNVKTAIENALYVRQVLGDPHRDILEIRNLFDIYVHASQPLNLDVKEYDAAYHNQNKEKAQPSDNSDLEKMQLSIQIEQLTKERDELKLENGALLIQLQAEKQKNEELREGIKSIENPYSKELEYERWVGAEFMVDTILRSKLLKK